MNLSQQHRALVEDIIKQNPMYLGHEYLLDKFCAEVYKKSYLLLDSVSNVESLKNYLAKVAQTSISNVIKTSAPPERPVPIQTITDEINYQKNIIEPLPVKKPLKETQNSAPKISTASDISDDCPDKIYASLIDPAEFFPYKPTDRVVSEKIIKVLTKIDSKNPDKKYLEIFKMRYMQNFRQSVIARNLRLSQADLSKRYCQMVKLIKEELA